MEPPARDFFGAVGSGLRAVGRSLAATWRAIDPDLRRHVAEVPLLGLTAIARPRPIGPLPDDGHRPVVFVHGLGAFPATFFPLRAFFRLNGRARTYAVRFPDEGALETMAAHLSAVVAEVAAVNGLDGDGSVDLVAHSMGGLVARLALADAATARRVATLVTLGTPHAGTSMARFLRGPLVDELRPGSRTLARLEHQLPWDAAPRPRLVCLWSGADLLLHPPTAARVDGARNVETPGFTHNGYLVWPAGWRAVWSALAVADAT